MGTLSRIGFGQLGLRVGEPWGAAKNVQIDLIEQHNESCAG